MTRLAICNCDLHRHLINWTLLYNTMEVSMLRLAGLTIAQHVFPPALTGRLELISRKNCFLRNGMKSYRGEQISRKIVSPELGSRSYSDFVKNIALLGTKKWGPTCDRDISNSTIYTIRIYPEYTVPDCVSLQITGEGLFAVVCRGLLLTVPQNDIMLYTGTALFG